MAHEIDFTTGKAGIAYSGATPWHGHGTRFDELMTSEQALEAAGLNFTVSKMPVGFTHPETGELVNVEDRYATVRTDTYAGLGTVGRAYEPIQNKDAFNFMDGLVADGGIRYEVAGSLFGGRQVWMLAKLPSQTIVSHDDVTNHYLLLSNGHDGQRGCNVAFTTVRVVCNNTLRMADGNCKHKVKIRHSGSIQTKFDDARIILGLADEAFAEFGQKARALSFKDVKNQAAVNEFICQVLGVKSIEDMAPSHKAVRERLLNLAETGRGTDLPGVKGTYWGLFNAVTEFVDHDKPAKGRIATRSTEDIRLESITTGGGDLMKQRAWQTALATI